MAYTRFGKQNNMWYIYYPSGIPKHILEGSVAICFPETVNQYISFATIWKNPKEAIDRLHFLVERELASPENAYSTEDYPIREGLKYIDMWVDDYLDDLRTSLKNVKGNVPDKVGRLVDYYDKTYSTV